MTLPPASMALQGLSAHEVQERTARGEINKAPAFATRTYGQILRENVFTFINNCLFGLGVALLLLGRPFDALVSAGVVLINAIVSSAQELQAKRKLDQIALLNRPQAVVVRDGQEQTIQPEEVVLGDVLKVTAGDQIIVDGRIVGDGRIEADESLVTGESDLIAKQVDDPVYSGSYCVSGTAYYVAEKIGADSLVHKITAGARTFRRVLTPLQGQINILVRVFLLIVIYMEILILFNSLLALRNVTESVQEATVIAGLIPNGLFLSIAVTYAISAVRILGFGVMVQQSNAIESLSNVDTLCVDKTGTLTANRLQMHAVHPLGISEAELQAILGEMAASSTAPNKTSEAIALAYDRPARPLRAEVPFSSARKWSAVAFETPERQGIYALGASEMLQPYLTPGTHASDVMHEWADQGLRVLLVASHPDATLLTDEGDASTLPNSMTPIGLISLSDELRPEARETLAAFIAAGVQPKIISGDNPQTVAALARQAGFPPDIQLISGPQLAEMSDAEVADVVDKTTIFGRITPQQKERLVQALRKKGRYVAMIGDGVNDVLSLKQANLGISMQSGSQATRNSADIVLANDSFAALVPAVQEGQRIINGMQDVLRLFLTRVAIMALVILSTLVISSGIFPITLMQASLLSFLTVGVPAPLIALWARTGQTGIHNLLGQLLRFLIPATMICSVFGLLVFYGALLIGGVTSVLANPALDEATLKQATILIGQTALTSYLVVSGLILVVFVEPPTKWWVGADVLSGDWKPTIVALMTLALYGVILFVPFLRNMAGLAPLTWPVLGLVLFSALVSLFVLRWIWRANILDRFLNIDFGVERVTEKRKTQNAKRKAL